MNKKIAVYSSIFNAVAVLSFALCMLLGSTYGSYIASMFIAFSFVPMMSAYCHYSNTDKKLPGYISIAFSAIYSVFILAVYFAQVTTVTQEVLNIQANRILDYSQFGLFFNYDLLGYGIMALATFFAGLTIEVKSKSDKVLKILLIIHGVFFISSFLIPLLGLFTSDMQGADWIGTAVLEFWCIYFIPIGVLSFFHFNNKY
jgi:hypothetical protein